MHHWKVTLSYKGTDFCGWQKQPVGTSVQSIVEASLEQICQAPTRVVGSGRTDAGVHALGQVIHFRTAKRYEERKLLYSMNSLLPSSIRAIDVTEASPEFHAQKKALRKTYCYYLFLGSHPLPFIKDYSWHYRGSLDMASMQHAANLFIGTHNFRSFSNQADQGSCAKNPVRTIYQAQWEEQGPLLKFSITGSGFLYKMVRNIVGSLVSVGRGKTSIEELQSILDAKERSAAPACAPPQGLFLQQVDYAGFPTVFAQAPLPPLAEIGRSKTQDH